MSWQRTLWLLSILSFVFHTFSEKKKNHFLLNFSSRKLVYKWAIKIFPGKPVNSSDNTQIICSFIAQHSVCVIDKRWKPSLSAIKSLNAFYHRQNMQGFLRVDSVLRHDLFARRNSIVNRRLFCFFIANKPKEVVI